MAEESFWKTAPGVLTAIAGFITAIGGIVAILIQVGVIGGTADPTTPPRAEDTPIQTTVATTTAKSTSSAPPASAAGGKAWKDVEAVITPKEGAPTRMRAETVRFCFSGGAGINLDDSQDIAFEKMSKIDVLRSDVALSAGGKATVLVTLTSGATREGTITSGCDFFGQAEEGRYSLYPDRLLKIEFVR